jgi:aldehyde:ferredoxin oxidoreductase
MNGYGGSVLRVNLNKGTIEKKPLDEELARNFIGGRGFASYTLFTELEKGIDPLGEKNKLLMISGPLSGMFAPGGGKCTFSAKSPLTGGYADSNVGGYLSAEMKYAGIDMITLEGKADKPSYLFIDDDTIELRDASKYWGKGTIAAEKELKKELGDDFQIATIGPAGENQVRVACINHDWGREAGRTGLGAVMGSKNIKAIAIRGTNSVDVADYKTYQSTAHKMFTFIKKAPNLKNWNTYGTTIIVRWCNEVGAFPTRNFSTGTFEGFENITGEVFRKELVINDKACFACPTPCGKYSHVKTDKWDFYIEGPEYETIGMLGGNVGIDDLKKIAYANLLCDDLGIDTISTGSIVAFAIDCFKKGIITKKDTDGLDLDWGKEDAIFKLIEMIAHNKGIGEVLSHGVKYAAKQFGKGSEKFAIQVKGMELSAYEIHGAPAMALAYMTTDIGAHHNRAWAITYDIEVGRDKIEGKAKRVIELQHIRPLFDMMGSCRLQWVEVELPLDTYPPLFNAITGFGYTWEEMLKCSEKVWNLNRCFWIREFDDFGRKWDELPARFSEEPATSDPIKGYTMNLKTQKRLLDEYYELRGWNDNGIPTEAKLRELGLDFAADDLKKRGRL